MHMPQAALTLALTLALTPHTHTHLLAARQLQARQLRQARQVAGKGARHLVAGTQPQALQAGERAEGGQVAVPGGRRGAGGTAAAAAGSSDEGVAQQRHQDDAGAAQGIHTRHMPCT